VYDQLNELEYDNGFVYANVWQKPIILKINPTFIIGGYDTKPSSGKLILLGYKKHLMVIPRGGKNFVPAVDVASAACNALTQGRNGERYLIAGENMSFKRFYKLQSIIATHVVTDVEFIAKEIVMLSNGKIIRSGSPSKLLQELDGKVWNIFLSDNEIDEVNTGYKVSNISRDADGVIARIIADSYDGRWQKEAVRPNLEDLYLYLNGD
jgi:hypothetical protein